MNRIAAIDIGTNTFRMLIAERKRGNGFIPIIMEREIVRLGEGYHLSSMISDEAMDRGIKTLTSFTRKMKENKVMRYSAVGTGVVRKTANTPEFLTMVKNECGLLIKVISSKEEAMLTLKGVELIFQKGNRKGEWLIFDIGGGSTEFIYCEDARVKMIESVDLGVVTLSDWIHSDPPLKGELETIEGEIENALRPTGERITHQSKGKKFSLIGTAGTVTTLAAMDQALMKYQPEKVNGFLLTKDSVKDIFSRLITLKEKEREMLPGLEKGRGKVIVPGCIILTQILEMFQAENISVCDSGLLEGIVIELLESLDNPTKLG